MLVKINTLLNDPGISEKAKKKLEKALEKLDKGDNKKGLKETGKAAKELSKAEKEGVDVADLIDLLIKSVREEAQDSIDTAIASGDKPKDIEKAQDELVKAQKELDKGKPEKAIVHYGHALEKARKVVK